MREFDLASDADLCFVIPIGIHPKQLFWTNVAERMIAAISSYTGDGVIFTVDTPPAAKRRPGRSGGRPKAPTSKYFRQNTPKPGKAISYMKGPRRSRQRRPAPPNFCMSCRKSTGAVTDRAAARRKELAAMRRTARKGAGLAAILSRPASAAITTSTSR